MDNDEKRSCGTCSLCCKLLGIKEIAKPAAQWCPHCLPGSGGCSIYATRPAECRSFECMWLSSPLGDEWRPTRSKMVMSYFNNDRGPDEHSFRIYVDSGSPAIWRRAPYYMQIKGMALRGLLGTGRYGFYRTFVHVRSNTWLVLPGKDVDITDKHYRVLRMGQESWDVQVLNQEEVVSPKEGERDGVRPLTW